MWLTSLDRLQTVTKAKCYESPGLAWPGSEEVRALAQSGAAFALTPKRPESHRRVGKLVG